MSEPERNEAASALWITGAGRCELRREPLPAASEADLVLESLYGAISRGTERLIFEGRVPQSERERMRGPHQAGDFPFPVKYGYALVAKVAQGPAEWRGETVFALHPHQDRVLLGAGEVTRVPAGIPPQRAVLAANMETALNVVWDGGIAPGDRVGIVGGGLVGLLAGWLASRIAGVETCLVDPDETRRPVAEALGIGFSPPGEALTDCDVVLHLSGRGEGLATALPMAGFEARIVEASWYGEGEVPVALGGAFHSQRLSIVASQVGSVPPARRARWTTRRRMETALSLLADDRLDILISGETPFGRLADAYGDILAASETLCHRIRYT